MPKFLCLFISFLLLSPAFSYSALIVKVKDKKALIHLQGVKTQRGAFFRVYNLDNKKKGLLKIERVAETKAIGTLKTGSMSRKWNLEPVSKRTALVELKKVVERKQKLALIQKEKMKRKIAQKRAIEKERRLAREEALEKRRRLARQKALKEERRLANEERRLANEERRFAKEEALEKRRQKLQKRRLAAKKKSLSRKVASFSLQENVLEDLEGVTDKMQQSEEILSYPKEEPEDNSLESSYEESYETSSESSDYPEIEARRVKKNKKSASYFELGLNLNPQFNYMKIKSQSSSTPPYDMMGLGGSAHIQSLFSYNSFLEIGGSLGYRYFSVSTPEGKCPRDEGCSLLVHYASAMAHLKFNILNFNQNKLWFLTEGSLMFPVAYISRVPNLSKTAFESMSLHGTVGAGLGFDFKVGNWVIPFSVNGSLHMPLSQTTLLLTGGLQTGFRYRF